MVLFWMVYIWTDVFGIPRDVIPLFHAICTLYTALLVYKYKLAFSKEEIYDVIVLATALFAVLSRSDIDPGLVGLTLSYSMMVRSRALLNVLSRSVLLRLHVMLVWVMSRDVCVCVCCDRWIWTCWWQCGRRANSRRTSSLSSESRNTQKHPLRFSK